MVKETDLSEYQRSEKLHALPAQGDQCPSELLASIQTLQQETSCTCFCSCFQLLSRVPAFTWAQLVSKKDLSLFQQQELADDIALSQAALNNIVAEAVNDHLAEEINEVMYGFSVKNRNNISLMPSV